MLNMLCGGAVYVFGVFSDDLKESLAFSQSQIQFVALAVNVGDYLPIAGGKACTD
jgi:hypothetical protein